MKSSNRSVAVLGMALLAACLMPGSAPAQPPLPPAAAETPKRPWGPEQALGAPDTTQAGDMQTAWASQTQDGGEEWLRLDYEKAVNLAQVRIRESYNPGAVTKVTAFRANGEEVVLFEGDDPTANPPADLAVEVPGEVVSKQVKVYLDTRRVEGWNEIDAVELVGKDGSHQWATFAAASSTYAVNTSVWRNGPLETQPVAPRGDPLAQALNKLVKIHLDGQIVASGTLTQIGPEMLLLHDAEQHRMVAVSRAKIVTVEWAAEN